MLTILLCIWDKKNNIMNSKESICSWFNNRIKELTPDSSKKYKEVQVPIFYSGIKKKVLRFIQFFIPNKKIVWWGTKKVSLVDLSKIIPPDEWKIYKVNRNNMIALPELTIEYDYLWEIDLVYEFFREDLQYGIRPLSTYDDIKSVGGGPVLIDKENNNIYNIGSGIWHNYNYIEDFALFKQKKHTKLDWDFPPNVKPQN